MSENSDCYYFNGVISILEAIRGIDCKCFTWSVVKAYYSAFYSMRAYLAYVGVNINFESSDNHYYSYDSSNLKIKLKRNTHASVLMAYKNEVSTRSIIQKFGDLDIPEWLKKQRELANYINPIFSDPQPHASQPTFSKKNIYQLVEEYVKDIDTYCYDQEHAVIAFPIKLILTAKGAQTASPNYDEDKKQHINTLLQGHHANSMSLFSLTNNKLLS